MVDHPVTKLVFHRAPIPAPDRVPAAVSTPQDAFHPFRRSHMSVLTRSALDDSPLADLHALASTLGIDGFRRLRKPDLADAILARQGGARTMRRPPPPKAPARRRRRRDRGGCREPTSTATSRPSRPTARPSQTATSSRRAEGSEATRAAPQPRAQGRRGRRRAGALSAEADPDESPPTPNASSGRRRARRLRRRTPTTSRESSSCCRTVPASSASRRPSRPTATSTSRRPRPAAASS